MAQWKATLLALFIIDISVISSRPSKIDLGFILDTSAYITNTAFEIAIQVIQNFANHMSISSGTTRVAVYTVSDELEEQFNFKKHVNRECLLKALHSIKRTNKTLVVSDGNITSEENTSKLLHKAIDTLRRNSNETFGQRRIYLFVTTPTKQMVKLKARTVPAGENDIYTILIGTNATKEFNKRKVRAKYFVYYDKNDYKEISRKLKLNEKSYSSCTTNGPATDECERHCNCVDGKLTDCYRVRNEFTAMSSYERRRYLKAYKTLTSTSLYNERYESFVDLHFKNFEDLHERTLFLPWHRWYLSVMEDLLREIDCRITIPYWDWSVMSDDPWNTTILWSGRDDGLGGNGHKHKGFCVQDGMFKESSWTTPRWEDPEDVIENTGLNYDLRADLPYCLRRWFHGSIPNIDSIKDVLKLPSRQFEGFNDRLLIFHAKIHHSIGGTMATDCASDAPEFFLHHSFLDKIWYIWQQHGGDYKDVQFFQQDVTKMIGSEYTRRDLIDSHDIPRCIKVRYTTFPLSNPKNTTVPKLENPPAPRRKYV